ncbi:MAG: site-specific integrase [Treponema sp.]|nr:site-specific integrase [Treponema sp.]
MIYHVFKKPVKGQSGREVHRWYYYWVDAAGKQHQKACKGCRNRSDAENYIRTLPPPPDTAPGKADILICDIAKDMFIPGSAHVGRRQQLGKSTDPETMAESRRYIDKIVSLWGGLRLETLNVELVMPFLFGLGRSGKWKNRFLEILSEIYKEAPWYNCRVPKPVFQRFAANTKKADIFTTAELDQLFRPENFLSYQFYLFFLLCLSGGLRLGEVRAIRSKQLIFDKKILIVDGFLKKNGTRTDHNKMGNTNNPKFRLVYLPEMTMEKMKMWINDNAIGPEDLCFTVDGHPIRQEFAETVFYRALRAAGFIPASPQKEKAIRGKGRQKQIRAKLAPADGRKLVPHSLRYTYVSRMRRELTAAELQPMTGHTSEGMVDYYNRRVLELALAAMPDAALTAADTLFQ